MSVAWLSQDLRNFRNYVLAFVAVLACPNVSGAANYVVCVDPGHPGDTSGGGNQYCTEREINFGVGAHLFSYRLYGQPDFRNSIIDEVCGGYLQVIGRACPDR
jgi:hypothetical protein